MTSTPPFPDLLTLIEGRSAALRDAVAAAPDLSVTVPGCPGWSLTDLVAHLGGVQRFWAAAVAAADDSGPPARERVGDQEPQGDLLGWSAASTGLLLAALRDAGPESPCWTWWAGSGVPLTAEAVARHQVQEAAVHAYDAQETIGGAEPLPAAVAVDGVGEFLSVGLGSLGAWPHRPARVALQAIEGPSWTLDLSPSGAKEGPAASGEPVTRIHATASDLVLALYRRIPLVDVRVDGDRTVAEQLLGWSGND
ncbi:maleylpyruvate isomerase family mycothiol-dependent enzyme [Actinoplanes sp. NEAU-A12]|uniref:Maleylpyruvate isomerase family mycothiol-dependent enzyme n=1 Tax=Actinoplanes sandaracinus TaxID=3045177 RepID=A0ABT6X0F3_9ACTN|nr:maleylpyruvate isomerase family mycothiol-dependent enzyme [Actinoplanes sandaracinus]MDI6105394.1 maleylpyruvate isomerase family mycothiol-dependent enzyme [Actinoplanes sandaracinus]